VPARKHQGIGEQRELQLGHHEVPAVRHRQERHARPRFHLAACRYTPLHAAQNIYGPLRFGPLLEGDDHAVPFPHQPVDGFFGLGQVGDRHLATGSADGQPWFLFAGRRQRVQRGHRQTRQSGLHLHPGEICPFPSGFAQDVGHVGLERLHPGGRAGRIGADDSNTLREQRHDADWLSSGRLGRSKDPHFIERPQGSL